MQRTEAIITEILTALADRDAPAHMREASVDVEGSTVRLDVTSPTGRKVFTLAPDAAADCWTITWRDEPATHVSGSLGYVIGGTPATCAGAMLAKINDFVTPPATLGRRYA
jgi:hypothetical protein